MGQQYQDNQNYTQGGPNWLGMNQNIGDLQQYYAKQQEQDKQLQEQVKMFILQNQLKQQFEQQAFQQNMKNYQQYAPMFNNPGGMGQPQPQQPQMQQQGPSPIDLSRALMQGQPLPQSQPLQQSMQQPAQQSNQNPFVLNPATMANSGKISLMKNPSYSNKSTQTQTSSISGINIQGIRAAKTPEERQALLDQLPTELATNIQQAGEYGLDANKIYGLRNNSGDRAKFDALVKLAYPEFDMKTYPQRQAYMNDLAKGKLNQQVISLNTVKKHLDTFDQAITSLGNKNWKPQNAIINAAKELSGDPTITDFKLAQQVVNSEMERLLTGVGVTQQGMAHVRSIISGNSGYKQMKDQVALLKTIINGRMQPLRTQYKNIMGKDESGQIVFPSDQNYAGAADGGQQGGGQDDEYSRYLQAIGGK